MSRFPKASRIRHKEDFDRLWERAHSRTNRCFVVRWISGPKRRLGIVVSKKVAKAYKRNAIKRVVRELFRLHPEFFPMGDILILPRHPAGKLKKGEMGPFLTEVLKKCL